MIAFFTFGGARLRREDAALAKDLAHLAASAIDGARLYAQVEEALRDRDEFLSIASHELRTPLTSLALQSDSLRAAARREQNEAIARKAEVIRRNVDRLSRLVASLLDLSRISAGRLELDLETVDLAEVAREVVARFEEEAQRAGVALTLDAPRAVLGRWDRLRLDQVVTNLVSNALKYGGGQPVEVTARAEGPRAVLRVRDRGIGIAPADQPRIFERFERAVSERNYGGFGLGLWITRQIVGALGGEIRVESAPGDGATFTVELAGLASGAREDDEEDAGAAPRDAAGEGEHAARDRLAREDEGVRRALTFSPGREDRER
jgi:signal transduction histidine kinase